MEITESRRLYQQLAAELKSRIEQGVYLVGDKLPAERFIADEKSVSRTVVREAIIMLEVEGYVEVRKGSGIHVISNHPKHQQIADESLEFANYGPFELLQARQLIESNIAEFAATQVTKQDIMKLMEIQEKARKEKCFRDSEWDLQFHVQVALATQNTALAAIATAVAHAAGNDVILVAGKGHEDYQEIQGVRRPFSDMEQAQTALSLRAAKEKA